MRQVTRDLMTNSLSAEFIRHSGGRRLLVSQVPSLPINSVRQEPHPPKFLPTKVDAKFLCHHYGLKSVAWFAFGCVNNYRLF